MPDEPQVTDVNAQPPGGAPPVTQPVTDPGDSGTPAVAPGEVSAPPESVPYGRFVEVNEKQKALAEDNKFLKELLQSRGLSPQASAAPPVTPAAMAQEPEFVPLPEPNPSQYVDEEGYEDPVLKARVYAKWEAENVLARDKHKRKVAQEQESAQANVNRAMAFVQRVSGKYQDFQSRLTLAGNPSDAVASAIIALDDLNPEAAEKVAHYLVSNPTEMQRVNTMSPLQASIEVGRLEMRVSAPVKPNLVSNAPPPSEPVKPGAVQAKVDPLNAPMETYAKSHPGSPPWLRE